MSKGKINVHSLDLFGELISAAEYKEPELEPEEKSEPSPKKLDGLQQQLRNKKKRREQEYKNQLERIKRLSQKRMQEAQNERHKKFVQLYNSLVEERETVLKEILKKIEIEEMSNERRKEQLYKEWHEKVFEPIQAQIQAQLENLSVKEIEERRRELYNKFLEESNKKAGIFRDIIIEADYDPLEARQYTIKYNCNDLEDPTKVSLRKALKEAEVSGKKVQKTKKGIRNIDVKMWDKIEATPHGHYSKMLEKSKIPKKTRILESSVKFDHYTNDPDAIKSEWHKGKRVNYPRSTKRLADLANGVE